MTLPTYVLIIGVTSYFADTIPNLPAAEKDALRVARAFSHWGIEPSHITLFLNEHATLRSVDAFLKELSKKREMFRFIFYFCGHGYRDKAPNPQSYLLLSQSAITKEKCTQALPLERLIETISQTFAKDIYIFIDACHLRVNRLINPKFVGEFLENQHAKRSLFCLLSSEIECSYEDVLEGYGYFTTTLLKYISHIRQTKASVDQIYPLIEKDLMRQELPVPEMYVIGKQNPLFDDGCKRVSSDQGQINRSYLLGSIQDKLVAERGNILFIHGEKGAGKTTLCRILSSEVCETIYLDMAAWLPKEGSSFCTIEKRLRTLLQPFTFPLIIFDHIEKMSQSDLALLIRWVFEKRLQAIFVSVTSLQGYFSSKGVDRISEWEMPLFSELESLELIRSSDHCHSQDRQELLHLVTKGNPKKIKNLLAKSDYIALPIEGKNEGLKKVIASVYSCGGYIDESLFIAEFQLEEKNVEALKKIGLLNYADGLFIPHHLLYQIAETEKLVASKKTVLDYWSKESANNPDSHHVASYLILAVKRFGYEKKIDTSLASAFRTLSNDPKKNLFYLQEGAGFFLQCKYSTNASLLLAEILAECGDIERSQALLDRLTRSPQEQLSADLCRAHLLWRSGKFQLCKETVSNLLKKNNNENKLYLHRGIANFFLGNWEEATVDFSLIQNKSYSKRLFGWAQCMLGTIAAIVKNETTTGRKMLESSIRLATKIRDKGCEWLGYNNLGEIYWKRENYSRARSCLMQALSLAKELKNKWAEVESLKNLLHLQLRLFGAFSNHTKEIIVEIQERDLTSFPPFVKLQILNSLATASILMRDVEQAREYIKEAQRLTKGNKVFHICTLSNLGMLNKMEGRLAKSRSYFQRAFQVAKQNNNYLATHELMYNYRHYGPQDLEVVKSCLLVDAVTQKKHLNKE